MAEVVRKLFVARLSLLLFFLTTLSLGTLWWSLLAIPHAVAKVDDSSVLTSDLPGEIQRLAGAPQVVSAPEVVVWYGDTQAFGNHGISQKWVNILGNVSDNGLALDEDAAYYRLNGGTPVSFKLGPGERRVYDANDFNVELDGATLNNGLNQIELTVSYSSGLTVSKFVTVYAQLNSIWPIPYEIEWSNVSTVTDAIQVIDGEWAIDTVFGKTGLRTEQIAYDRAVAIGDQSWTEYEVLLPVTVLGADNAAYSLPNSVAPHISIITRWNGHTNNPIFAGDPTCLMAHCGWLPQGANPAYNFDPNHPGTSIGTFELGGDFVQGNTVPDPLTRTLSIGTTYWWKVRVDDLDNGTTKYGFKVWQDGQAEPLRYQMEGIDASPTVTSGSLVLVAHHVDALFGDVSVSPPAPIVTHTLTTTVAGNGTILVDPIYDSYMHGETVTVTAIPDAGWAFDVWSGSLNSANSQEVLTFQSNLILTATFSKVTTAPVSVAVNGPGYVDVVPDQPLYELGQLITLTAIPTPGSQFNGWSGPLIGQPNPTTLVVGLQNPVEATFGPNISGIQSDSFSGCALNTTVWSYVAGGNSDPLGPEFTGSQLALIAPSGQTHLNTIDALSTSRVMQNVNNTDFHVEIKLGTLPKTDGQMSGVLIYGDDNNWYNFQIAHVSGGLTIGGYGISNGSYYPVSFEDEIVIADPQFIRLQRIFDTWYLSYSADATAWIDLPPLFYPIAMSQLGLYAGNESTEAGNEPKQTAIFDYIQNLDALTLGDPPVEQYGLNILNMGGGQLDVEPDLPGYGCNQTVVLNPVADHGWHFDSWGGALSGAGVPASLELDSDKNVTAHFSRIPTFTLNVDISGSGLVSVTPDLSGYLLGQLVTLTAVPEEGQSLISWKGGLTGNQPTKTLLMNSNKVVTATFGIPVTATLSLSVSGDGYILADPAKTVYDIGEQVTLTGIPHDGAAFFEWGDDPSELNNPRNILVTGDAHITATFGINSSGIRSDDFDSCQLSSFWSYATGHGTDPQVPFFSGSQVALSVPGDHEHYHSEDGNQTIRISQPANDADFQVEVKFASEMNQRYQTRGIFLEDLNGNTIYIDFYYDGNGYNLYSPPLLQGEPELIPASLLEKVPTYVRLERSGEVWHIYYSADGLLWGHRFFSKAFSVTRIGIHAGNTADIDEPFPPHVAIIDYFLNRQVLTPGDLPANQYPLNLNTVGHGDISVNPGFELFGCNQAITLAATPSFGHGFSGWSGDVSDGASVATLLMDGPKIVTGTFSALPTTTLTVNTVGPGTIGVSPTQPIYFIGQAVTLTATPSDGLSFLGWSGDLAGTLLIEQLHLDGAKNLTGTFGIPLSVTLSLSTVGGGHVKVTPSQESYKVGDKISLTGIPDEGKAFAFWSGDLESEENPLSITLDDDLALTANFGSNHSGIRSDDFNSCQLSDFWTYLPGYPSDPPTPGLSGSQLALTVPGDREHYLGTDQNATVRIFQETQDTDFAVEVKFASSMHQRYQTRGLFLEDSEGDTLQIEFFHDGLTYSIYSPPVYAGNPLPIPALEISREPTYVRLTREGDDWTVGYSADGERWSKNFFTLAFEVNRIGIYAGNTAVAESPFPRHDLIVEHFYNLDALTGGDGPVTQYPLTTESFGNGKIERTPTFDAYGCNATVLLQAVPDYAHHLDRWEGDITGGEAEAAIAVNGTKSVVAYFKPSPQAKVMVSTAGPGTVVISPSLPVYLIGEVVKVTAMPDEGSAFTGWHGDQTGLRNPLIIVVSQDVTLTANFAENNLSGGSNGVNDNVIYLPLVNSRAINGMRVARAYRFGPLAPSIDIWYGSSQNLGQHGIAQKWFNIPGNVSDANGVTDLRYSLNGSASQALATGPGLRRIAAAGDFNIALETADLIDGPNQILISATNGLNQTSVETVTVNFDASGSQSFPYIIDWSTVSNVNDVAQAVDGKWTATASGVRTTQVAYDRILAIGDVNWTDYEVEVPITIHGINEDAFTQQHSLGASIGLILRWQEHTLSPPASTVDCLMAFCGWEPQGANPNYSLTKSDGVVGAKLSLDGGNGTRAEDPLGRELSFGTTYIWKARIETLPGNVMRSQLKVWEQGQPEPPLFQMTVEEPAALQSGSLLLLAHQADVTFGDVSVTVPEEIETATLTLNSLGSGLIAALPDQSEYVVGQEVTVSASPADGWVFEAWQGDLTGHTTPMTVEISADMVITGLFRQVTTTTLTLDVVGDGTIQVEPDLPQYAIGQLITVTAIANHGAQFMEWGEDLTNEIANPVQMTVGLNSAIAAAFGNNESNIYSDNFNDCQLASFWLYEPGLPDVDQNPAFSGLELGMTAPEGGEHYAADSVRLTQSANDVNFAVETRFSTQMEFKYQARGVLVTDAAGEALRFEFFHDGSSYNLFVAQDSDPNGIYFESQIAEPRVVRVTRENSSWHVDFSPTGNADSWERRSVSLDFSVARIGLFVGNTGDSGTPIPEHSVLVDYFHNRSALAPHDSPVTQHPLKLFQTGQGKVKASPPLGMYGCDQPVKLTAMAAPGYRFDGWSGDVSGDSDKIQLVMDAAKSVTANFSSQETVALEIRTNGPGTVEVEPEQAFYLPGQQITVTAIPENGFALLQWGGALRGNQRSESLTLQDNTMISATFGTPAFASISLVPTTGGKIKIMPEKERYEIGEKVTLTAIANDGSSFTAWGNDLAGLSNPADVTISSDLLVSAEFGANQSGILSDDFNSCQLASFWEYQSGYSADAQFVGLSGTSAILTISKDREHFVSTDENSTLRISQRAQNTDLEVELKFNSEMSQKYQTRGIYVEDPTGKTLSFEFYHDGSGYNIYAPASEQDGSMLIPPTPIGFQPVFTRMSRAGDDWTISFSEDGEVWVTLMLTQLFVVDRIGVYGGNTADPGAELPEHDVIIDYFYNLDAIKGGDEPIEQYSLNVIVQGEGSVGIRPQLPAYGCDQTVTLTAVANDGAAFDEWSEGFSGESTITIQMNEDRSIVAKFGLGSVYLPVVSG